MAGCRSATDSSTVNQQLIDSWAGGPLPSYTPLTAAEIQTILGGAVEQGTAQGSAATVAVVDRDGFVLGVFAMTGAPSGPPFPVPATAPPDASPGTNAAIAKARTAAFLSSNQAALSSRTAGFIIQPHFPPGIRFTPAGPLFGVGASNMTGTDVVRGVAPNSTSSGPLPDPNGFSGLPGGIPLYKGGFLVGAVGVSGTLGGEDEKLAVAGSRGFFPPIDLRASQILVDGIRLDFVDVPPPFVTPTLPFVSLPGGVVIPVTAGAARPTYATATFGGVTGELVFSAIDSPLAPLPKLLASDVTVIFNQAMTAMVPLRAAIRLPIGSRAKTTVAVVDTAGNILGAFRPPDNTLFSLDVAVQKARTSVVYSGTTALATLQQPITGLPLGSAVTTRAVGFMAQPFYPPGIDGTAPGPLFGIQGVLPAGLGAGIPGLDVTPGVTGDGTDGNGLTLFPGGIPLYKGGVLVGAIGVSGDGVDQDDFVAAAGAAGFEPPPALRCDNFAVQGVTLPYVKFPRNPYDGVN
jgi:uncharacterized protein GlcG (DUF336 family)